MSNPEIIYLVDGSAYIYRAYHAITPLSNKKGLPTHATFGFINILKRVIKEKKPSYLAVAFDAKGRNFRHALYDKYKANRPPMPDDLVVQVPYIKKFVEACRVSNLELAGVEADDLIASAARVLAQKGYRVVIVSGDKDLFQLASDLITVWDPMSDKLMDPEAISKRYNVGVEELLDYYALIGDTSDNIPGVPGVGPKTAAKLIHQFGTLDALYDHIDELGKSKLKEKLINNKDQAYLAKKLIRLKDDVGVPESLQAYLLPEPDEEELRSLYKELEFTSLIKSDLPAESLDTTNFRLVQTADELAAVMEKCKSAEILVVDAETDSLDIINANIVGISLCVSEQEAFYIPVGHRCEDGTAAAHQLPGTMVFESLRPFLEAENVPKLGHNLKYDYAVFLNHDISLGGPLMDTMIASYLLDPLKRSHKLDTLCEDLLDFRPTSFAEVTKGDKREDSFAFVPLPAAKDYSCEDVMGTLMLWKVFKPQLEEFGMWRLFTDIEMALMPILARIERHGITVDPVVLEKLSRTFADQIMDLEEEIFIHAGEKFNINSPKQLGEILFEKMKLPAGRKTKTGYSTDVKVLEKLAQKHDLPALIIRHRMLSKLKSTYVDKLQSLIHPRTRRIHTSYNQTVTATGRLSSSNPNLQNIPVRTEEGQLIRRAFVAAKGCTFLAADYSQIDLRVLAHYCKDKALVEAFRSGEDIHNQTAAEIFRVNSHLVTKAMRRVAKTINFGIVYGMSAFGLASQLNLSRKEANIFIERYFDHYSGVRRFMQDIVQEARDKGYVETFFHRRRQIPDINSSNKTQREFAERAAINMPIQGTAADIIKLATVEVEGQLQQAGLAAKILLQIHDELVLEVPDQELEKTEPLLKSAMESVVNLDVPLTVNISMGHNLSET